MGLFVRNEQDFGKMSQFLLFLLVFGTFSNRILVSCGNFHLGGTIGYYVCRLCIRELASRYKVS